MQTYDITMMTMTYGGEAMGRLPDGRAVFVPYVLPGEKVRIRLVEEKKGYAHGEPIEVLQPSPDRIQPRCPHFMFCGGCHYQHIPYEKQLTYKQQILRDQLERIGGLNHPPVEPARPSPQEWYYRNYIQFHFASDGQLGFQARHTERVIPIEVCFLPEQEINSIWPQLDLEPVPGLERISLRQGAEEEAMLILEASTPEPPEMAVEDLPISVVHTSPAGSLIMAGSSSLLIEVLGKLFIVSAESFFQVNTLQAAEMVKHLLENLPLTHDTVLLELYSGVGLFSAFLAPKVARLVAVESSVSANSDFEVNLDEFDNVELYEGTTEAVLPHLDIQPDIVLVDPPRAGLGPRVVDRILALQPKTLAYVSCDPATLARDGKRLAAGGYRLTKATPFDMFPQTYHIESISFWNKE
jgi:23S rRNA (uracil1939-C5)-methyltransferase